MFKDGVIDESGYKTCGSPKYGYSSIIDAYGNIIAYSHKTSQDLGCYSEGMFFYRPDKCFYDINMNKIIDLSDYPLYFDDYWPGIYSFTDGYCKLVAKNDEGTIFYSLIDAEGNFIIDWTLDSFEYVGKLSNNLLNMGTYIYNLNTSEKIEVSSDILHKGIQVNGKIYYIDAYTLYYYDITTNTSEKVKINGLVEESDYDEKYDLIGLWRRSGGKFTYFFGEDLRGASYDGDGKLSSKGTFNPYKEDGCNMIEFESEYPESDSYIFRYVFYDDQLILINESGDYYVFDRVRYAD